MTTGTTDKPVAFWETEQTTKYQKDNGTLYFNWTPDQLDEYNRTGKKPPVSDAIPQNRRKNES